MVGCCLSVAFSELVPHSQRYQLSMRVAPALTASPVPHHLPLEFHDLLEGPLHLPYNPERTLLKLLLLSTHRDRTLKQKNKKIPLR